jgi:hypothetical protein
MAMMSAGRFGSGSSTITTVVTHTYPLGEAVEKAARGELDPQDVFAQMPPLLQGELNRIAHERFGSGFSDVRLDAKRQAMEVLAGIVAMAKRAEETRCALRSASDRFRNGMVDLLTLFTELPAQAQTILDDLARASFGVKYAQSPESGRKAMLAALFAALEDDQLKAPASAELPRQPPGAARKPTASIAPDRGGQDSSSTSIQKTYAEACSALGKGNIEGAVGIVSRIRKVDARARNLEAVCRLRLGKPDEALDLLRPLLFPHDGFTPDESIPAAWIVNFATGLLLRGDVRASIEALHWVKDPRNPGANRLRAAIDDWRRSLTLRQRFVWWLGGSARPIRLSFEPGEL